MIRCTCSLGNPPRKTTTHIVKCPKHGAEAVGTRPAAGRHPR